MVLESDGKTHLESRCCTMLMYMYGRWVNILYPNDITSAGCGAGRVEPEERVDGDGVVATALPRLRVHRKDRG